MRLAVGAIFTECNELGGLPIDIKYFERHELRRGRELLSVDSGALGGMLEVLRDRACTPVPLLWASCPPGGSLTIECYEDLREELLASLRTALPVAGVLLPLHGAAVFADPGGGCDLEGDLITRIRALVGPKVPIVATLDLHAHITQAMVSNADALLAWETYPHADAYSTGERGARLLVDTLTGKCQPTMAAALVPVITGAIRGATTGNDPFAEIMRMAKVLEASPDVLSTSAILVDPYLDQPQMGSGAIVVTNNAPELAARLAIEVAEAYWDRRNDFEPNTWSPEEAIADSIRHQVESPSTTNGPIVLVETADCCGGGAAGDSVATLVALLDAQQRGLSEPIRALVPVVDPEAAATCHTAGAKAEVTLSLGHKLDTRWGKPIEVTGTVRCLSDGRFTYKGGIFDGTVGGMGPSALLRIGSITVLISSHGSYDWRDEQWEAMGVDPRDCQYVVAKNPMNYRQVYGEVTRAIYILDTPGPTPASVLRVRYKRLQQPFFPQDSEAIGTPLILT
jgi:microcystin degradation protein MlrC